MASTNQAAYIPEPHARYVVKEAPYPTNLEPNELLVHVQAVAINPVDWKIQTYNFLPRDYPAIDGKDIAGSVVAVGSAAGSKFKIGDRVCAYTPGITAKNNHRAGFQRFVVVSDNFTGKLPDSMSFTLGSVISLGCCSGADGLYSEDKLALPLPSLKPQSNGQVVLVWGGSSSVGISAIQLATASGFEVISTASLHNHDLVRSVGATQVFDHSSPSAVKEIISYLKGKPLAGTLDAIADEKTVKACVEVINATQPPSGKPKKLNVSLSTAVEYAKDHKDIEVSAIYAVAIGDSPVGAAIFNDYLGPALAQGKYKALPEPLVIGKGLESVQHGVDTLKAGVSAKKIVVEL